MKSQFKKIYIDKEGGRDIDFMPYDLIICQKTDSHGANQLRGIVYQVNNDSIIVLEVQSGDWSNQDIVRIGNEIDKDRQSCIVISAEGIGAPYESMISEIDSFEKWDSGAGRDFHLGNLDLVKNNRFPKMRGKGMFAQNVYLTGEFALSSGEDVGTILKANAKGLAMSVKKAEYVASLKILKDSISQKVAKDDVVSIIKQTASEITIKANKIDIDGLVPKLKATFIGVNKLDADNIDVKSLKAKFIGVNKLNADNINFNNAIGTNVNLTGIVNALRGEFGGWTIKGDYIESKDGKFKIMSDGNIMMESIDGSGFTIITDDKLPIIHSDKLGILIEAKNTIESSSHLSLSTKFNEFIHLAAMYISSSKSLSRSSKKTCTIEKGARYILQASNLKIASDSPNLICHPYIQIMLKSSKGEIIASTSQIEEDSSGGDSYSVTFNKFYSSFRFTANKTYTDSYIEISVKAKGFTNGRLASIWIESIDAVLMREENTSIIASNGMRFFGTQNSYLEVNTEANTLNDFFKVKWGGLNYGLVKQ